MKNTRPNLQLFPIVTTLVGNQKGPVEFSNPNINTEAKLCLFIFLYTSSEIVCRETEVPNTVSSG